jgi:hypothetical protein
VVNRKAMLGARRDHERCEIRRRTAAHDNGIGTLMESIAQDELDRSYLVATPRVPGQVIPLNPQGINPEYLSKVRSPLAGRGKRPEPSPG